MAILGIGIDQVEVKRFEKILAKDDQFLFRKRVFSESEIIYCEKSVVKAQHYAVRFAAKEAFIKASSKTEVRFTDVVVERNNMGKPDILLSSSLEEYLKSMGNYKIHVTLTHTELIASAFLVIEIL